MNSSLPKLFGMVLVALLSSETSAQEGAADYTVRFEATWSRTTHPLNFPSGAHFSGLIGGTHDQSVSFWTPGELASAGIERMAETGSKTPLDAEVRAAIDRGDAGQVVSGGGTGSPGAATANFAVTPDFPLVSIVTMIAPSPDWFVGVHGLDLREGGTWAAELRVDLFAYDAGTDSGSLYTSRNDDTVPPEPISRLRGDPFDNGTPFGSFIFVRTNPPEPVSYLRGDSNSDGSVDISDGIHLLLFLFSGGAAPDCQAAADFSGEGRLDLSTAIYLFNFLFLGGPAPTEPFPDCAPTPLGDLGCASYSAGC